MSPKGPYKLLTVNNAPERARRLIGRVVELVKDSYEIIHVGNVECFKSWLTKPAAPDPATVRAAVESLQPDVLFTASMWTAEESLGARRAALDARPGMKTFALPQGLQVQRGPDAVVDFLVERLPGIVDGDDGVLAP